MDENAALMEQAEKAGKSVNRTPQIIFASVMLSFIGIAIVDSWQQSFLGDIFPLIIGLLALPFALWLIWILIKGEKGNPSIFDAEQVAEAGTFKASWYEPVLWIGGLYIGSSIVGFIPSIILFFISFLTFKAKTTWLQTALLTASAIALLSAFGYFLNLEFPKGILF